MFIFQFLNDKIYNYVKQNIIVNFIIQKLKNKHTFLKKYTNWAILSFLVLREREEKKNKIFRTLFYIRFNTHHLLRRSMSLYQNKGNTLWPSGHEIMHLCSQKLQKMRNTFGYLSNFESFFKAWKKKYYKEQKLETFRKLGSFWLFLSAPVQAFCFCHQMLPVLEHSKRAKNSPIF